MTMTGLWPAIAKMFEAQTGYRVEVVATGPRPDLDKVMRAGQVLSVSLKRMRPSSWGCTTAGGIDNAVNRWLQTHTSEPSWLLWELDADAGEGVNQYGHSVALAPFLGVIGLAPEIGQQSTIPPRTIGAGNIDCKELVGDNEAIAIDTMRKLSGVHSIIEWNDHATRTISQVNQVIDQAIETLKG